MGSLATSRRLFATVLCSLGPICAWAQTPLTPDWVRIGNPQLNLNLAGPSTGAVNRIWYGPDGRTLYALTALGKIFSTTDFESWQASQVAPVNPQVSGPVAGLPEPGALTRAQTSRSSTVYAFANFIYRSADAGESWNNLTGYRGQSIIGAARDLAVSPRDPDEVAVATHDGVYRSLNGGESWSGVNEGLPNFPRARILSMPAGAQGARLELREANGSPGSIVEWMPGQRAGWSLTDDAVNPDRQLAEALQSLWGVAVTAAHREGNIVYAGLSDGHIRISTDGMANWRTAPENQSATGPVEAFWVDPQDPRNALAVLGSSSASTLRAAHVLRTTNFGGFWDNVAPNLPDIAVHGVAAGRVTGAVYIATDSGAFYSATALKDGAGAALWQALPGLPQGAPVSDVKLDAPGNTLWAAVQGYGVFATPAPHRRRDPQLVSSADMQIHPAAPGALMTVAGAEVTAARTGNLSVSVLRTGNAESQIQIPFNVRGDSLALSLVTPAGVRSLGPVPLATASPVIFVDRDGSPILFNGDSGDLVDAAHPARPRDRIQIMATGLGQVRPELPAGVEAPAENPPNVVADVRAFIDGQPVNVTLKELAPLYAGWNLIEIEIPRIVNEGGSELYLDVDGHASNHVRLYIEP